MRGTETAVPIPSRDWRAILSELVTDEDLLTNQGQEVYALSRESLPPSVQRWRAAFGLCLWLGNGWADVAYQHRDDLALGVSGFEDCDFELGASSGRAVIQVFVDHGLDPFAADFEERCNNSDADLIEDIEHLVQTIDDQVISDIWDASDQLHELMIKHAHYLAAAT